MTCKEQTPTIGKAEVGIKSSLPAYKYLALVCAALIMGASPVLAHAATQIATIGVSILVTDTCMVNPTSVTCQKGTPYNVETLPATDQTTISAPAQTGTAIDQSSGIPIRTISF
jgi:spore coat protein U-like protein